MKNKQLFFITGPSGSGANLIAKILSNTDGVLGIGSTHANSDHFLIERFNEAQKMAYSRHSSFEEYSRHSQRTVEILDQISNLQQFNTFEHIVFKRPMINGDIPMIDICEIQSVYPGIKIIVVVRNPMGSTHSSNRRKLGKNLRHCAVLQEEQLSILNIQTPPEGFVISFDHFCVMPKNWAAKMSKFTGIDTQQILSAMEKTKINTKRKDAWKTELSPEEQKNLITFFSERNRQWSSLFARSQG